MTVFVLQDAQGNFLTKSLLWSDDCTATGVFHSPHKDSALNQLLEINAKDPDLRAHVVACEIDQKNKPLLPHKQSIA